MSPDGVDQSLLNVLGYEQRAAAEASRIAAETAAKADAALAHAADCLLSVREQINDCDEPKDAMAAESPTPAVRSWTEICEAAAEGGAGDARIEELLSAAEIDAVLSRVGLLRDEFDAGIALDNADYIAAALAGVLAALVDTFLVGLPRHRGFLGGARCDGGWLSNYMKDRFGGLLPDSAIRALEERFKVPFDPSTSFGLDHGVSGLGPPGHRFQSLGHDPVLGWIFGVTDILRGTFTAVDREGAFTVQRRAGFDASLTGQNIFVALLEAFARVGGHLLSDVATPAGLPAPLMPLASFLQVGNFGKKGRTVAELAKLMYRSGYDFRHFLAGSVPTVLIEVLVRGSFYARRSDEIDWRGAASPLVRHRALGRMLFVAHATSTAINAGRVTITRNPLALNWSQWLVFFRYLIPQAYGVAIGNAAAREAHVAGVIDQRWDELRATVTETFEAECRRSANFAFGSDGMTE